MEISLVLAGLSAVLLWGGAAIYILAKPEQINPVPWIIWSFASFVAAVNTAVEDGVCEQAFIFGITGLFFAGVVVRRWRVLRWEALPAWQKTSLPILAISPVVSLWASPLGGIILQAAFAWVTAVTFIQTAASGFSRDHPTAWWIELSGCLLLFAANDFLTRSWILPLNSSLVSAACLAAVYIGRAKQIKSSVDAL
jgi:hypothetical protein